MAPWAVAFHSARAIEDEVPPVEVEPIGPGELPANRRLAAPSAVMRAFIDKRGHLTT